MAERKRAAGDEFESFVEDISGALAEALQRTDESVSRPPGQPGDLAAGGPREVIDARFLDPEKVVLTVVDVEGRLEEKP